MGNAIKPSLILLTGTINPDVFKRESADIKRTKMNVYLTDSNERLNQYKDAISKYITDSVFTDIVFVENSGHEFPVLEFEVLAGKHGKRFEFLSRTLTETEVLTMLKKGKSWGEADLIDYAVKNSKLIKEYPVIYKCTGRCFLTNSKKIVNNSLKSAFSKHRTGAQVSTHFFKLNISDYYNYLEKAKELIGDYNDSNIETTWYNMIVSSDMEVDSFRKMARVHGICAGSNTAYDRPKWKYFLLDMYLFFGGKTFNIK